MPSFSSLDRGTIYYHSAFFQRGGRDLCFLFLRARAQVTLGLSSRKAFGCWAQNVRVRVQRYFKSLWKDFVSSRHLRRQARRAVPYCTLCSTFTFFFSVSEKREQGKTEEKEKELQKSCLSTSPDRK